MVGEWSCIGTAATTSASDTAEVATISAAELSDRVQSHARIVAVPSAVSFRAGRIPGRRLYPAGSNAKAINPQGLCVVTSELFRPVKPLSSIVVLPRNR
jgi:hypothetical protein